MKRVFSQTPTMTRLMVFIVTMPLMMAGFMGASGAVAGSDQKADVISAEDYALYDQVVTSKFLTSATQLVVIERMTRLRLSPDQEGPTTARAFQEQDYFDGELPADLIRDFISINRQVSRLEGRFHFAAGYRFATGAGSKSRRCPSHVQSRCPARCRFTRRRFWIVWRFLAWREASQRSCAPVCRNLSPRRHRSGISRVVPPSRAKVDIVRYGSRLDHSGSGRARRRAVACALMGLDGSMHSC